MNVRRKSSLLVKIFNWSLVIIMMGIIFILSSQGVDDSARLSSSVLNVSAVFVNRWQLTLVILFLLFSVIVMIWIIRRSKSLMDFVMYLVGYLFICLLGLGLLYFVFRPYYLSSNIHGYNYWTVHRFFRKYAHLFIYLGLGVLVKNALTYSGIRGFKSVLIAILLCSFYAVFDEVHQYFVPGRTFLVSDILIDTVGATIGILIYTVIDILCGKRTIWQAYWNL